MGSVESGPIHSSQVVRFSHMSTSCLISCEGGKRGGREGGREGGGKNRKRGRRKEKLKEELKEGVKEERRGEGSMHVIKTECTCELFCYSCLANTCTSMENNCI